ncbi:MAG: hypothetical protein KC414_02695 [Romboutsia sp.]|nr:hypothetical protein [Romboutsia sp.]
MKHKLSDEQLDKIIQAYDRNEQYRIEVADRINEIRQLLPNTVSLYAKLETFTITLERTIEADDVTITVSKTYSLMDYKVEDYILDFESVVNKFINYGITNVTYLYTPTYLAGQIYAENNKIKDYKIFFELYNLIGVDKRSNIIVLESTLGAQDMYEKLIGLGFINVKKVEK